MIASRSAKGIDIDPVSTQPVQILSVISPDLAKPVVFCLERVRTLASGNALDLSKALAYCLFGPGPEPASDDAVFHALVQADHICLSHSDAAVAIAVSSDGAALTARVFEGLVGWTAPAPWTSRLGTEVEAVRRSDGALRGCVMGGHGVVAWGASQAEAEHNSQWIAERAANYFAARHGHVAFHASISSDRAADAVALVGGVRGLVATSSTDGAAGRLRVGHYDGSDRVLRLIAAISDSGLAAMPSPANHAGVATTGPLILDRKAATSPAGRLETLTKLRSARSAAPDIVLVPSVGLFAYEHTKTDARRLAEAYVSALTVYQWAGSVSTCAPNPFDPVATHAQPELRPLTGRIALVTGGGSGIGKATAHRLAAEGACVVVADLDGDRAHAVASAIGDEDVAVGVAADISDEQAVQAAIDTALLAYGGLDLVVNNAGLSLSKPLLDTTADDFDLQHRVMAKGSFLVSKAAARIMIAQGLGGDIVYICSKNSIVAGPHNIAYSAAKASQAHQVRLLAAELGEFGIRVNGVNPDGVVRGSGIFADGWGANRAALYGVAEADLGAFYAQRTLLKREVFPEHVANAVYVLCGPDLTQTTGAHLPVDAGVSGAFLR